MRRLLLAFAILAVGVALNGCAAVKVEVDDAHKGYAIYSNGEKVCDDSRNCYVPVARGDEMYLEAEKNGVVYGEVVIHRGDGGYSTQTVLRRGSAKDVATAVGMPLGIAARGLQPLETVTTTTEYFPKKVMIPVMPPENDGNPFPWDKPDPSK